ncbi:MAG: 3-dehydroquinate synthase [Acidobacteria bacterium]|nr:3-dehydroquinate synthase [Acidobacteriota bacterium]
MPATRIEVTASAGTYPVIVGAGVLDGLESLLDAAGLGPQRIVVSSPTVWAMQGARVRPLLRGKRREPVLVPDGERSKTLQTVGRVYDALIRAAADRSVIIVALGGGVIGDLVGFAAATYLRGVRLVHVPTTLLAQVDSAIGGKVGVNHPLGKNLIGAFHPPRLVVADPLVLSTLPRREFRAGLYEVIKYGVIADPALFALVRTTRDALFAHEPGALESVIAPSCRIKAEIVSRDERESSLRRILNFGHTVGHALEAVTDYRRFRHGEAVAYGMMAAASLGARRGLTPVDAASAIKALILELGPLPPVSDLKATDVAAATRRDKKVVAGTLHFIAATRLGATTALTDVTEKELKQALREIGIR